MRTAYKIKNRYSTVLVKDTTRDSVILSDNTEIPVELFDKMYVKVEVDNDDIHFATEVYDLGIVGI